MSKLIAHRGLWNNEISENTYLAIKGAFNSNKYMGVEFDIRLTIDNKIVVIHDSYINRTSNGSGKVETMTLKELQKYNYGKTIYQSIPTLDKILDINTSKIFLIEIKVDNNEDKFAYYLVKKLENINKNIFLTSFSRKVLLRIKELNDNLKVGLISILKKDLLFKGDFYVIRLNHLISPLLNRKKKIFIWQLEKEIDNNEYYLIIDDRDLI